jgi:hypothetical protein
MQKLGASWDEISPSQFLSVLPGPNKPMAANRMSSNLRRAAVATLLAASFGLANAADVPVVLTGDQEVPAVTGAWRP